MGIFFGRLNVKLIDRLIANENHRYLQPYRTIKTGEMGWNLFFKLCNRLDICSTRWKEESLRPSKCTGLKCTLMLMHDRHKVEQQSSIQENTKLHRFLELTLLAYLNREDLYCDIFAHQLGFPNTTKAPPSFDFQQLQWFQTHMGRWRSLSRILNRQVKPVEISFLLYNRRIIRMSSSCHHDW